MSIWGEAQMKRIMLFLPPTPSLQVSSFRLAIRGHNWGAGGARGSWTSVAGIHCFTAWINSYQTQINVFFRKTPPKNISCHFFGVNQLKMFQGKLDALTCSDSRDIGEQRAFYL